MKTLFCILVTGCQCVLSACLLAVPAEAAEGPLAEYVSQPDASYQWTVRREGKVAATAYSELILTSQTWRDIVWKHQLFIIRPASVPPDAEHALLFITGGNWKEELARPAGQQRLPGEANLFAALAEQIKLPVAILLHVPQQPIFNGKREDQIIAYTFEEYLKTGDTQWPLLLPMVKSAVRGMDAVQEFAAQKWALDIKSFTVTGASKRGWTTWLTGAVDPRATAIAPMVIDVLNMGPQMRHQKDSWGDVSYEIRDYTERDLIDKLEMDAGRQLREIVDPYSYRNKLKQPKLIIIGTNDHYWPLDALNLYWDDLIGPKYILYMPNDGHGLKDYIRLTGTLNALLQHAGNGTPLPKLSWDFANGDAELLLKVDCDVPPQRVNTWIATSATRDFRQSRWTSRAAERDGDAYLCRLTIPEQGYAAIFGEAVFDGQVLPYYLSTNVRIVNAQGTAE